MYKKLKQILREREMSVNRLSFGAMISPSDLYSALQGNRPMYPNWRKRIAECLGLPEEEIFEEEWKND